MALYGVLLASTTASLIRADARASRSGDRAAWIISTQFVFQWAIAPVSYSFGLFAGALSLLLGVGAAVDGVVDRVGEDTGALPHTK